jgi:predicted DNA-binding WGR domain protein
MPLAKGKTEPKKRSRSAAEPTKPTKKVAKAEGDADVKIAKKTGSKQTTAGTAGVYDVHAHVPDRKNYKVVDEYSFVLNQTNIGANNNKYYVGQVLESGGKFHCWLNWGRVGETGQNSFLRNISRAEAISAFQKKFQEKTSNSWASRANFKKKEGKYQLVETEKKGPSTAAGSGKKKEEESSSPLGKLSKAQLDKGLAVLDELKLIIKKKTSFSQAEEDKLVALSSKFFSLIPTDIGRKNTSNLVIRDMQSLKEKEEKLKFWNRMGYDVEQDDKKSTKMTPISGVLSRPLPKTLKGALRKCDGDEADDAVEAGVKLEKKQVGNPSPKMDRELYGAIAIYTGSFYSEINECLRNEDRKKISPFFNYLKMLFEACDRLKPQKRTLWRGIGVDLSKQYKVGSQITWWSISSTTSAKSVAENFMYNCDGVSTFCTIEAQTAIDISAISLIPSEREFLLLPGTQFLVKKAEKKGKTFHVTLEEIGRLVS